MQSNKEMAGTAGRRKSVLTAGHGADIGNATYVWNFKKRISENKTTSKKIIVASEEFKK